MSLEHSPANPPSGGAVYLTARQVRARYGDIADYSLYRWQHDPNLNFPAPLRVNNRRLWSLAALERWERQRASDTGAEL